MNFFKINPKNGFISLGASQVITPKLKKNDFLNLFNEFSIEEMGFDQFMISDIFLGEESVRLVLRFDLDSLLPRIDIGVKLSKGNYGKDGWPDYNTMIEEVDYMKNVLGRQLCRSFDKGIEYFSWGSAWTHYLERDSSVHSGIGYAR